MKWKQSKTKRS